MNSKHSIFIHDKPNDCVVCGMILHELGACSAIEERRSGVVQVGSQRVENDAMHHIKFFYAMVLIISDF